MMHPETGYALEWLDLWQTPDQQGQKAFQQQQFDQAAGQFDNPGWKAASQYRAGQYEQVLDTLKDTQTSQGLYNKGNAHVKQGQLQEALEAYEKSLEIDPENADAQYNKELVEKELEKQQQQQNQQQEGEDSENKDQKQEQQNEGDSQDQQGDQGDQSDTGQEQKQEQQESKNPGENQQGSDQQESDAEPEPPENQSGENEESAEESKPSESSEEEAETGEKEAEASSGEPESELKDESEQASEQWLKRIPDDPAGLLKRKFEYQYKRRNGSRSQQQSW